MSTIATCSFFSSWALRFASSALSLSFASSLGFLPGLCCSRPAVPLAPTWARHAYRWEL